MSEFLDLEIGVAFSELFSRPQIGVRIRNCLLYQDIATVRDLVRLNEWDLLRSQNFGRACLKEVQAELSKHGLALGARPKTPAPRAPFDDGGF